eukprot:scaffold297291_cov32-Tisochrysis_lutea.AAC.2
MAVHRTDAISKTLGSSFIDIEERFQKHWGRFGAVEAPGVASCDVSLLLFLLNPCVSIVPMVAFVAVLATAHLVPTLRALAYA